MTIRYLLDTNIVIFALRHRSERLRDRLTEQNGRFAVSASTVSELHFGIEKSSDPRQNRQATEEFLALIAALPFDADAATHAGEIGAVLGRAATPIGAYDVLIAGHARSAGLAVVTNNVREFSRVPGLLVEDWSA